LDAVLQEPEVREALLKLGYQPALGTAEEFAKFLVEDEAINRKMAEELKLRVE
jgi:tripartite-type tricarboxylate transporter receptor subunit TctC